MAGKSRTRPYNSQNAGALSLAEAQIDFAAADARVLIASLPANAVILDAWVELTEAFDSGTSDELNIGYGAVGSATSDDILDAVDGQATGVFPTTRAIPKVRLAAAQDIYVYHLTDGTAPTAGSARAFIVFARTADNA